MINFQDALNKLRSFRDTGEDSGLTKFLSDLEISIVVGVCQELPRNFFDGLLSLLEDPKFLALEESWNLADFLRSNWELLSDEQRVRIRPVLTAAFDKYKNWMGAFVTAEILGENFADERTLTELRTLLRTAKPFVRHMVPHALVYLARATTDEGLRSSAVELLRSLSTSEGEDIREEAITGLRDLDIEN